jgi:hypothetical protein
MYAISNRQREEALLLLAALREQPPAKNTRAANNRRRAGILIDQLRRAREMEFEDVKNLAKTTDDEHDTQ